MNHLLNLIILNAVFILFFFILFFWEKITLPKYGFLVFFIHKKLIVESKYRHLFPENLIITSRVYNIYGLCFSIILFLCSLNLWLFFDKLTTKFQYVILLRGGFDTHYLLYVLGLDGISLFFILLTTFIFPLCFLSTLKTVKRIDYILFMFSLEFFLILSFSALDLFLFFVFFESILVPMFLLVGF
jgi:NADH:ubiquinone oxidoreductase subunit 4 (subunit M)